MTALKVNSESIEHLTNLVEKLINQKEKCPIGPAEFTQMLNIKPETLDVRISVGRYMKPFKDDRKAIGCFLNLFMRLPICAVKITLPFHLAKQ